jgi:hypothetical protein
MFAPGSYVVKAIAYRQDYLPSDVFTSPSYVVHPVVAVPTITPNGGNWVQPKAITLVCATAGATIRYTTDGSIPTADHGTTYSAPFNLVEPGPRIIKAVAFNANKMESDVLTSFMYKMYDKPFTPIAPVLSSFVMPNGLKSSSQLVLEWVEPFDNFDNITGYRILGSATNIYDPACGDVHGTCGTFYTHVHNTSTRFSLPDYPFTGRRCSSCCRAVSLCA